MSTRDDNQAMHDLALPIESTPATTAPGHRLTDSASAAEYIEKLAADYLREHASTEGDTGAVVWHFGDAGRDYHSTLVELAEDLRSHVKQSPARSDKDAERAPLTDRMTERKTAEVTRTHGYQIVGYVMQKPGGDYCLSSQSAVRWLDARNYWRLMHEQDGSLFAAKAQESAPSGELSLMRTAFRTTSSGASGYAMTFKFRSLEELDAADDEWRAALARRATTGQAQESASSDYDVAIELAHRWKARAEKAEAALAESAPSGESIATWRERMPAKFSEPEGIAHHAMMAEIRDLRAALARSATAGTTAPDCGHCFEANRTAAKSAVVGERDSALRAEPAGQHEPRDAMLSALRKAVVALAHASDNPMYTEAYEAVSNAIEAEVDARCRAEGGVTCNNSSSELASNAATAAPTESELDKMWAARFFVSQALHNVMVGNQSAWIEWKHGAGAEAAMQWIENGLIGPGLIPSGTEAQAWFDANEDERLDVPPRPASSQPAGAAKGGATNDNSSSELASNAATAAPGDLPPLPAASGRRLVPGRKGDPELLFNADRMREYGRACIASNAGAAPDAEHYALICEKVEQDFNNEWNQDLGIADKLMEVAAECAAQIRRAAPSNPPAGATQEQTK
jgi:hypothetical protein